jgi:capsid portal protein
LARSKIIELFTRLIIPQDRKDKIYCNGSDNQYPERIERVINNSVTAKLSVDKFISYLVGHGFDLEDLNDVVINKKKGLTFYNLLTRIAKDVGYQKGFYLHINYDLEGKPNYLDVLKFKNCRISEEDDNGYSGYVWYQKNWDVKSVLKVRDKSNRKWYYPYNPDIKVINAQRNADAPKDATAEEKVKYFRGQVLFVNLDDDSVYPNSKIDPAYNDADTEHRISLFRNDRVRNGFIGATIAVIPEVADEKEWNERQKEFKGLLGVENTSNILLLEAKKDSDKPLSDYVHIQTVESNITTELFEYDEKTIQENILNCYSIPKILVKNNDSALFGASGESLRTAQKIFQEDTQSERDVIQNTFNKIFKGTEYEGKFNIAPLLKDEESNDKIESDGEDDK